MQRAAAYERRRKGAVGQLRTVVGDQSTHLRVGSTLGPDASPWSTFLTSSLRMVLRSRHSIRIVTCVKNSIIARICTRTTMEQRKAPQVPGGLVHFSYGEIVFRIRSVRTARVKVEFNQVNQARSYQIAVITGPNGSGKTELLTALASSFRDGGVGSRGVFAEWSHDGQLGYTDIPSFSYPPNKVIAQTFSPFSRFAEPDDDIFSLTDKYADGRKEPHRYRSIGFHRKSRYIGGTLSKHTLEQGLFGLSEAPEQARAMAGVLEELGFRDQIYLVYRKYPAMREILRAFQSGRLREYLDDLNSPRAKSFVSKLARETREAGSDRVASLLESALEVLSVQLEEPSFDLLFSISRGRPSADFAVMQALALLRRLRVLRLERCELTLATENVVIDISNASSGQQQMLCSIFGLVAELRSDSLVLIDEPELSLHPTWQMSFLDRLQAVLSQFHGCHVLISTHSPLIVQSALQQGIEVIQLQSSQGPTISSDRYFSYQQRVSVEGALLDVFHTPISDSVYLSNEIFGIVAEGEHGGAIARNGALARLQQLRHVYDGRDAKTNGRAVRLIDDAINLLKDSDEDEERSDAV